MSRQIWIDATFGASGDMLLGALLDAGVPVEVVQTAVDAVSPEPVRIGVEEVQRGGLRALKCHVSTADSHTHRTWRDIAELLARSGLSEPVREKAHRVFARLAEAEAEVHGVAIDEVHFHEVGALDAIADVVGVAAAIDYLDGELRVSAIGVGSGTVRGTHGVLSVPPPAVARLLQGFDSHAGPATSEACTPTGAALLTALSSQTGPQPAMRVGAVGIGAGSKDFDTHANVVRVLVGGDAPVGDDALGEDGLRVLETNVDDLDPRIWPEVLSALLAAGAADAWLTPILMKKGRPAHTLSALVGPQAVAAVRQVIFTQTTTIGLREYPVARTVCDREMRVVDVEGQAVSVKVSSLAGEVLTVQPEYDEALAAARALGWPVAEVIAHARALAAESLA